MRPSRDGVIIANASESMRERFWRNVDRTIGEAACWLWGAFISPNGYGQFSFQTGKAKDTRLTVWAHRCSYLLTHGSIPDGLYLDHLCRNRSCVNPSHLQPVSARENLMRGDTKAANNMTKTHCPSGHAYTGDNLRVFGGSRQCRTCVLMHGRKYDAKRRQRRREARVA